MTGIGSLTTGFLLGLSTGPVCVTTCFPMLFPFAVSEAAGATASRRWLFLGKFLGGRLLAYLATGAVAGFASQHWSGAGGRLGLYAWLGLSVLLIAYGAGAKLGHGGFCGVLQRAHCGGAFPFVLGALTGLSVCPPFLLALSYLVERSHSVLNGMMFFTAFFLATSLYIAPVGFLGHIPRSRKLELVGRVSALAVGGYFLFQAFWCYIACIDPRCCTISAADCTT